MDTDPRHASLHSRAPQPSPDTQSGLADNKDMKLRDGLTGFMRKKRQRTIESSEQSHDHASSATPAPLSLTEMEKQVVALKNQYPDMLLMLECGYRMRLFREDAENAARVLGIRAQRHRAFTEASVPVHRALFHSRRLVDAGYKVGVVKQLSAVATPRQPLERDVVEVYTRATIPAERGTDVDLGERNSNRESGEEELALDDGESDDAAEEPRPGHNNQDSSRFILALCEETLQNTRLFAKIVHDMEEAHRTAATCEEVRVGVFCYDVHTGETVFDEFEDVGTRAKLRDYLALLKPVEFVIPVSGVSPQTEQMVAAYAQHDDALSEDGRDVLPSLRIERVQFRSGETQDSRKTSVLSLVHTCMDAVACYLRSLKMEVDLSNETIRVPRTRLQSDKVDTPVKLSPASVRDLCIFGDTFSASGKAADGSLFGVLNHTKTPFGARCLRNWLAFPLTSTERIRERQDAIEILTSVSGSAAAIYESLREDVLPSSAPLERLLQQLHLRRAGPAAVLRVLRGLAQIERHITHLMIGSDLDGDDQSCTLTKLLFEYPCNTEAIQIAFNWIDIDSRGSAMDNMECAVAKQWGKFEAERDEYLDICGKLRSIKTEYGVVLDECRRNLELPSLDYSSYRVGGIGKTTDHLIVVDRSQLRKVPDDWYVVSSTKSIVRYCPRHVRALQLQEDLLNEKKAQVITSVWLKTMAAIDGMIYVKGMLCMDILAQLDSLCSLATVVRLFPNYVRPQFSANKELTIVGGRHPMLELLGPHGSSYIAGDIALGNDLDGGAAMIISGPNMGGKSTMLRMVALLTIMAQAGSFVPATTMILPVFDAVHSRMHRQEGVHSGDSTRTAGDHELRELAALVNGATRQSLVLLDEVGFGLTSQHAKVLAFNSIKHLVSTVGCLVLVATHMTEIVQRFRDDRFREDQIQAIELAHDITRVEPPASSDAISLTHDVVYHYSSQEGVATRSYALQAAATSGLPGCILDAAMSSIKAMHQDK